MWKQHLINQKMKLLKYVTNPEFHTASDNTKQSFLQEFPAFRRILLEHCMPDPDIFESLN